MSFFLNVFDLNHYLEIFKSRINRKIVCFCLFYLLEFDPLPSSSEDEGEDDFRSDVETTVFEVERDL